jgi:hypothetical protein
LPDLFNLSKASNGIVNVLPGGVFGLSPFESFSLRHVHASAPGRQNFIATLFIAPINRAPQPIKLSLDFNLARELARERMRAKHKEDATTSICPNGLAVIVSNTRIPTGAQFS